MSDMAKVYCDKSGKIEWANRSGKSKDVNPKCCKCGLRHVELKS